MATIELPIQIANKAGCGTSLESPGMTLQQVVEAACEMHPGLRNKIFAAPGKVNRFVRLFVDGVACAQDPANVAVSPDSKVKVLIAMAGG